MSVTGHTATPWIVVPQNGNGHLIAHLYEIDGEQWPTGVRHIALMLERKASLAEDRANAELIVTCVNAWHDTAALEARIFELRNAKESR